ncbi:MAG: amidohydrolase family protein, partial [Gemmatimonadota bacterium]
ETGITHTPTLLVSYGGPFGENFYYATEPVHDDAKLRRFTPHAEIDAKSRRRGRGSGGWFMAEEYVFERHARFAKELIEAGGRVGVGSHGQLQGLGYHWELWSLQSGGMSEHNALRAATILGAEAIGFGHDIGSLETGKLADLIVFDANPLDAIRNTAQIRYVMKNGRLYDGETLDEVYPRERPFPALRWADREPDVAAGMR